MRPTSIALIAIAASGCFQSIAPDKQPDGGVTVDSTKPTGPFGTARNSDGTYTTVVDSTSTEAWTHGDFETGMITDANGPWDLRFQRFHISTNGGVSGSGGVEVTPVAAPFAGVTTPPASGWLSDAADGNDTNMDPDYAFEQGDGWYDYDSTTHVLEPKPLVWIVKTNGGSTIKLEITAYYDDAGTAGWFTLHWSPM
jgi:hypothetical protein